MTNYLKENSLPLIISIFSVILFTSVVAAHDNFSNKRDNGSQLYNGVKTMKQLDLSDEQKAQIKDLFGQRKELAAEAQTQRSEIRSLIEAGDINAAAEIAATQARARVTNISEKKLAVESILTPEQLTELNTLQAERQLKREQRAEKRASRRDTSDNA